MKKIKLSIVAAKYIWPTVFDPILNRQNQFASMLMKQMFKGKK